MYSVKILKDSVGPSGKRITTWELTYPRFVHAELMTHRLFSRNSASSRAIPNKKLRQKVKEAPLTPVFWGKNQAGMGAEEELTGWRLKVARTIWSFAKQVDLFLSWLLAWVGLHKQIANRRVEADMFITIILTATEYDNWFKLRDHKAAQPEIAKLARMMKVLYDSNQPDVLREGEWHIPLISKEEIDEIFQAWDNDCWEDMNFIDVLKMIATGRCARVSYLTHDGKRDWDEDVRLCHKLRTSGHWSPFEHVAQALAKPRRVGNFLGWKQYRKEFAEEHPTSLEDVGVFLTAEEAYALGKYLRLHDHGEDTYNPEHMAAFSSSLEKLGAKH